MRGLSVIILFILLYLPTFAMSASLPKERSLDAIVLEKRESIQEIIELDESGRASFWQTYDAFESELRALVEEHMHLFETLVNKSDLTDQEAEALIEKLVSVQHQTVEVQAEYLKQFRKILPHDQLVDLVGIIIKP